MEGSQVLILMTLSNFHNDIISHAEKNPEEEVCGFVILNPDLTVSSEPAINENRDKEDCFEISASKFIDYKLNKKILGIYHSHPRSDENPSNRDKKVSEEMGIPYLIYSLQTKKFFLYYPESYSPDDLLGRPYVKGFYECTCLFKDYFEVELGINITKWHNNYWLTESDKEANIILEEVLDKNLNKINLQDIKKHDVIVFQIKDNKRKHVGMYLGDDYFIHQCGGGLSQKQFLDGRWQKKIKGAYRHPSLV